MLLDEIYRTVFVVQFGFSEDMRDMRHQGFRRFCQFGSNLELTERPNLYVSAVHVVEFAEKMPLNNE